MLGAKHPQAFGRSAKEVWGEVWEDNLKGPAADALAGTSTFGEDALFIIPSRAGNDSVEEVSRRRGPPRMCFRLLIACRLH